MAGLREVCFADIQAEARPPPVATRKPEMEKVCRGDRKGLQKAQ